MFSFFGCRLIHSFFCFQFFVNSLNSILKIFHRLWSKNYADKGIMGSPFFWSKLELMTVHITSTQWHWRVRTLSPTHHGPPGTRTSGSGVYIISTDSKNLGHVHQQSFFQSIVLPWDTRVCNMYFLN